MKKLSFLSLIVAVAMITASCSVIHKNGKSKDKPATEQAPIQDEDFDD